MTRPDYNSEKPLRVVIMAGGTGGHVFPALAVAEKLRQKGATIDWLGTAKGIEARLVPTAGFPLHCLSVEGVRGRGWLSLLKAPFLLLKAITQSIGILRAKRADVVLGLGGFASGPGGVAAWLLRKPLLVHEQNAIAGTTNRLLSRLAKRTLLAFPNSLPSGEWVGNPVRDSIAEVEEVSGISSSSPLNVLVLGGSLGALALNDRIPEALATMSLDERPKVRHQTGSKHIQHTRGVYQQHGVDAEITDFIDDMASAYEWADCVICRAGALTVSELTLAGRPALLVPYPYAIDDHQTANANWLVEAGAAMICQQTNLTTEVITEFVRELTNQRDKLKSMADRAKALAQPDAAVTVAHACVEAAHG